MIETPVVFSGPLPHLIAYGIGRIGLQQTILYFEDAVPPTGNVESQSAAIGYIPARVDLFCRQPAFRCKAEFHFVPIAERHGSRQYARPLERLHSADAPEVLDHFIVFPTELILVDHVLPDAAAAKLEMRTGWICPRGRGLDQPMDFAHQVTFLFLDHAYIGQVTGYGSLDHDGLPFFRSSDRDPLGTCTVQGNAGKDQTLVFWHGPKILRCRVGSLPLIRRITEGPNEHFP